MEYWICFNCSTAGLEAPECNCDNPDIGPYDETNNDCDHPSMGESGRSLNVESRVNARDLLLVQHQHQLGQTCRYCTTGRLGVEVEACRRCGGAVHHRVGQDGPEAVCLNCGDRGGAVAMPMSAARCGGLYG